jgi:ankyrin repeat protein
VELGADPLAVDGSGMPAAAFAPEPGTDRAAMEKIRTIFAAEEISARRGNRQPRVGLLDMVSVLALGEWTTASKLLTDDASLVRTGGAAVGALHLMAKRNDLAAAGWLLDHGADPNARWAHGDAEVTPLHLAAARGHADMVRLLLAAGSDPTIHDSRHDSDPVGWAEFFKQPETAAILKAHSS